MRRKFKRINLHSLRRHAKIVKRKKIHQEIRFLFGRKSSSKKNLNYSKKSRKRIKFK